MNVAPEFLTNLQAATVEVFDTMVFKTIESKPPTSDVAVRHESHIVATVAFTGYRCGLVSFHSSTETAREIAAAMLGVPPEEVGPDLADAIGEIANMIAGTFRTKMATFEPAWALGVPTVIIGSDFSTQYVANGTRLLCPFAFENRQMHVELILTAPPSEQDETQGHAFGRVRRANGAAQRPMVNHPVDTP